ncbi:hypothetical protein VSH64_40875 [Amycolatopsis rhabdoformis]|uniref:Uncharacterized protein n=1 Tax=Amycolatopsis rhabdoformis TaxID=1448059 RepID=A0ABZ1I499_9PSEU|nr:hypothetical protein [Amycolatopsis rhabdoformis]WSE29105.1 hypothetical protein VSH64_40875 [Amycolatopsis rhabdoformis]
MADSIANGIEVTEYDESFGKNAVDAAKKTPFIGKGVSTISNLATNISGADGIGDIAAAGGQLVQDGAGFVAGAAADVASFALDPVGWLVSNGLNMLLELVQPMQDALHFVTGDGPSLKTASGNFTKIGTSFVALADDFVKFGDDTLRTWQGEGGDAARKALAEFSTGIKGIGSSAGAVAETLQMWSMVMTVIEEVVKAIISELVSWLIYIWIPALAASVISLGSTVAAAMTASVAKAAGTFSRIAAKLGKLGELLTKFAKFLAKWTDDLIKQGAKFTRSGTRVTPGMEKTIAGAVATGGNFRIRATADSALDVVKGVPKQVFKQVTGVNPADLSKGSAYVGKGLFDMGNKAVTNARDMHKAGDAGDASGHHTDEETRENLDMDQ